MNEEIQLARAEKMGAAQVTAPIVFPRIGRHAAETPTAPPGLRIIFATTLWTRARGLLHRPHTWLAQDEALVLVPCASVHTLGMRYPLDIAFVDAHGVVVRSLTDVMPGRVISCRGACAVLERFSDMTLDSAAAARVRPAWPQEGEQVTIP